MNNKFLCTICNNTRIEEEISFSEYSVRVCSNCKYGEVYPMPSQQKLNELYNSNEYYASHMNYNFSTISEADIRKKIDQNKLLHGNHLKPYLENKPKEILEIGSGGGFALKALEELGHHASGVETSSSAVDFSRNKLKVNVDKATIESTTIEKQFDIVMLNHVLEHFLDVKAAAKKLSALVKSGGVLYVRVPDHDSYDRRKYVKAWPAYAYYHISNFSGDSLTRLFSEYGFEIIEVKKFISEKTPKLVKLFARGPLRKKITDRYSGRSITIIARKS